MNSLNVISQNEPWYKQGLNFKCTECGQCCTGSPGHVWVSDDEIQKMADYLKISVKDFNMRYIRRVNGKLALVEMSKNYDCIFLKDRKCSLYTVRPKQCRTFPWWPQNLSSKEAWDEAALYCEGIQKDAPIVPLSKIESELKIQLGH